MRVIFNFHCIVLQVKFSKFLILNGKIVTFSENMTGRLVRTSCVQLLVD